LLLLLLGHALLRGHRLRLQLLLLLLLGFLGLLLLLLGVHAWYWLAALLYVVRGT
jgi:hypothetical protein